MILITKSLLTLPRSRASALFLAEGTVVADLFSILLVGYHLTSQTFRSCQQTVLARTVTSSVDPTTLCATALNISSVQ